LERAGVGDARSPAGGSLVALGDLIFNRDVPIIKATAEDTATIFRPSGPLGQPAGGACGS
jgi:hypothetical protein